VETRWKVLSELLEGYQVHSYMFLGYFRVRVSFMCQFASCRVSSMCQFASCRQGRIYVSHSVGLSPHYDLRRNFLYTKWKITRIDNLNYAFHIQNDSSTHTLLTTKGFDTEYRKIVKIGQLLLKKCDWKSWIQLMQFGMYAFSNQLSLIVTANCCAQTRV
jgi:hypothetical protein